MFLYIKEKVNNFNNLFQFLKENLGNGVNIIESKDIITIKGYDKNTLKISKNIKGGYTISNGDIFYGLFKDYNAILKKILKFLFPNYNLSNYSGENKNCYFNKNIDFIDYGFSFSKIPEDDIFGIDFKNKNQYLLQGLSKKDISLLYNKELNFREDNINLSCLFNNDNFFINDLSLNKYRLLFQNKINKDYYSLLPEVYIDNIFKYLIYKRKKNKINKSFSKITDYKFVNYPLFYPDGLDIITFLWGNLKISISKNGNSFNVNFFHKYFPEKIIKTEKNFNFLIIAIYYINNFFIDNFFIDNIPKKIKINDFNFKKKDKVNTMLSILVGDNKVIFSNLLIPFNLLNKNKQEISSWSDISKDGNNIIVPDYYTLEDLIIGKLSKFLPINIHINNITYLFNNSEFLYGLKNIISHNSLILSFGNNSNKNEIIISYGEEKNNTNYILINNGIAQYKDKYLNNILEFI